MSIEKRLRPRVTTDLELTVRDGGTFAWKALQNLSGGGVFIKTDAPQSVGSTVVMQLQLPGDCEIMQIEGQVIWIKPGAAAAAAGMGIEFTAISMEHQEKITLYVDNRLRERPEDLA